MSRWTTLLAFFGLAYVISWLVWAPLWLPVAGIHALPVLPYHHALGAIGPIAAAFILTAKESGRAGVIALLRRLVLWRGRLVWIAVGGLGPVLLVILAVGVASIMGQPVTLAGLGRSSEFPHFSFFGFLAYNVLSFGYGEEVGWRGFALPRLQSRYNALVATILLTCGWAVWPIAAWKRATTRTLPLLSLYSHVSKTAPVSRLMNQPAIAPGLRLV